MIGSGTTKVGDRDVFVQQINLTRSYLTAGDYAALFIAGVVLPILGAVLLAIFVGRKDVLVIMVGSLDEGKTRLWATGGADPAFIDALKEGLGSTVLSGTGLGASQAA